MSSIPLLRSSVSRKLVMSLTGIWLCVFLVVHLAGNLTLFLPADQARPLYNAYTRFMTTHPLIKVAGFVNYAAFLVHIAVAVLLTVQNRRAKGSRYVCDAPGGTSEWYSRRMGVLGALVFVFLVLHLKVFWYRYHFGEVGVDAGGLRDMYGVVVAAFGELWYVAVYVVAMLVLGFHLLHGFASGFRTLGLHHRRYWRIVRRFGAAFAVLIALTFALMPIWVHLTTPPP